MDQHRCFTLVCQRDLVMRHSSARGLEYAAHDLQPNLNAFFLLCLPPHGGGAQVWAMYSTNVDILNRCNNFIVESQLQGKRLRWLGCLTIDRLTSFSLMKTRGVVHLVALGQVSMILQ